jgi:ribonuclease P protein component
MRAIFVIVKVQMAVKFTLNKTERLKSRKAIDALFSSGRKFSMAPFRIFFLPDKEGLKFGIGVSNRNFKKAADRNRIKRLTREAYRLQKNELSGYLKEKGIGLNLFFIYTEKEMPEYKQVFEKMNKALTKLLYLLNENNTSAT